MRISDWNSDVCSSDLRQLLSVLVEPIRAEMDFSDTQFGLLTGFAFALFYAAAGVPVAMIADRWNRVKLIVIACVVWSGFTPACGMASNFWQLALMRFGVGAGDAGGTAPAPSVIADYYDRKSVGWGMRVSVRVVDGGSRYI